MADLRTLTWARSQLPEPAAARRIRVEAKVSMELLAHEIGVSWWTLRRWELGEYRPRGERLVRYVKALQALQKQAAGAA